MPIAVPFKADRENHLWVRAELSPTAFPFFRNILKLLAFTAVSALLILGLPALVTLLLLGIDLNRPALFDPTTVWILALVSIAAFFVQYAVAMGGVSLEGLAAVFD